MYDQYNYTRALILIEKFVFDTGQCVVGRVGVDYNRNRNRL